MLQRGSRHPPPPASSLAGISLWASPPPQGYFPSKISPPGHLPLGIHPPPPTHTHKDIAPLRYLPPGISLWTFLPLGHFPRGHPPQGINPMSSLLIFLHSSHIDMYKYSMLERWNNYNKLSFWMIYLNYPNRKKSSYVLHIAIDGWGDALWGRFPRGSCPGGMPWGRYRVERCPVTRQR